MKYCIRLFLLAFTLFYSAHEACAWPTQSIKLIIPYGPAGTNDKLTRALVNILSTHLDQHVYAVNIAGKNAETAWTVLKYTKSDGYTLLSGNAYALTILTSTRTTLYNIADFDYLYSPGVQAGSFFALPKRGWKDLKDMFNQARNKNKNLKFGYQNDLELFIISKIARQEKVSITPMRLENGYDAVVGVLDGHLDFSGASGPQMTELVAGKLIGLSNYGGCKYNALVPTLCELGYDIPDFKQFVVFAASKGLPELVRKNIVEALKKACAAPEFLEIATSFSMNLNPLEGEKLLTALKNQQIKFKEFADFENLYGK